MSADVQEQVASCAPAPPCGCGCSKKFSTRNCFTRCFETVGCCHTTVDITACTKKCVSYITKCPITIQTVSYKCVSETVLKKTNTTQRFIQCKKTNIKRLTTCWTSVFVLTTRCVTYDKTTHCKVNVQSTTCHHTVIKGLKTSCPVHIHVKCVTKANQRNKVSKCGCIPDLKIVHETVHECGHKCFSKAPTCQGFLTSCCSKPVV